MTGLPTSFLYGAIKVKANFASPDEAIHSRLGTGFLVSKAGTLYLVTNRHNVDAVWKLANKNPERYRNFSLQEVICYGRIADDILREFRVTGMPVFSNRYNEDVAVFSISMAKPPDELVGLEVKNYFHFEDLAKEEEFGSKILPCDQVVFPSYGEGYSKNDDRPIFRVGWISSDPTVELEYERVRGRALLVEGFSTGGASGAPVIALPVGLQVGMGLIATGREYRPMRIIGVNAGHLLSENVAHPHISYAFKASIIREIIENA